MKLGVDLLKSAQLDPSVNLCRRDRDMPEHFLDNPEVSSPGKQMSGEAVPERVRADLG